MGESSLWFWAGALLLTGCPSSATAPGHTPYSEATSELGPASARHAPPPGEAENAPAPSSNAELPDACQVPVAVGACEDAVTRWAFDVTRAVCHRFTFTGCEGNANNFRTLAECESTCPVTATTCSLPIEAGNCKGSESRWAFDHSQQSCVEFTYTGCGGNENNFQSHDECEVACLD